MPGKRFKIPGRRFYERPADEVARSILGMLLEAGDRRCRIIEAEAYLGFSDPASRVRRCDKVGRRLFSEPGRVMVYTIHTHLMINIIAHPEWMPGSVFIRGCIIDGRLVLGPGRVSRALAFKREYDGLPVYDPGSPVRVVDDGLRSVSVESMGRVGVREDLELPLRYRARMP